MDKKEHKELMVKQYKLKPIGTRLRIVYPKDKKYYEVGVVIGHFETYVGMIWDYELLMPDKSLSYHDASSVEIVNT